MSSFRSKKGASLSGDVAVAVFLKAKRERVLKALSKRQAQRSQLKRLAIQLDFPVPA
jgi:hypothetical protein